MNLTVRVGSLFKTGFFCSDHKNVNSQVAEGNSEAGRLMKTLLYLSLNGSSSKKLLYFEVHTKAKSSFL